jgi:hypothetical protein
MATNVNSVGLESQLTDSSYRLCAFVINFKAQTFIIFNAANILKNKITNSVIEDRMSKI